MQRTTIVLPTRLKRKSMERARANGISFAEFVRKPVELALIEPMPKAAHRSRQAALEAMHAFRKESISDGPSDLAKNLDDYLYGTPKKSKREAPFYRFGPICRLRALKSSALD